MWLFVILCTLVTNVRSDYDNYNSTVLFANYKRTFHRAYPNKIAEEQAFKNFENNLKSVIELNDKARSLFEKTGIRVYSLNKYADIDPVAFFDKYSVVFYPYDYTPNERVAELLAEEVQKRKPVEEMDLYDLFETQDLYNKFLKDFNKHYSPRVKEMHYYKFSRTLIDLNNKKFYRQPAHLDENADVFDNSAEYYFDGA